MEGKAETRPCAFCKYQRSDLIKLESGLADDPELKEAEFCQLCANTVGAAAYFTYYNYRHEYEVLRCLLFLHNANLDLMGQMQADMAYIRSLQNNLASSLTGYSKQVKGMQQQVTALGQAIGSVVNANAEYK